MTNEPLDLPESVKQAMARLNFSEAEWFSVLDPLHRQLPPEVFGEVISRFFAELNIEQAAAETLADDPDAFSQRAEKEIAEIYATVHDRQERREPAALSLCIEDRGESVALEPVASDDTLFRAPDQYKAGLILKLFGPAGASRSPAIVVTSARRQTPTRVIAFTDQRPRESAPVELAASMPGAHTSSRPADKVIILTATTADGTAIDVLSDDSGRVYFRVQEQK